jgi:hypothetical protein
VVGCVYVSVRIPCSLLADFQIASDARSKASVHCRKFSKVRAIVSKFNRKLTFADFHLLVCRWRQAQYGVADLCALRGRYVCA